MNTNVNVQVVANNRKPLSIIGANLGTQYFTAEARSTWPDFEKDKLAVEQGGGIDLIINRAPRRYRIFGNDVTSVQIATDAIGATKVFLNKGEDSEVSLPITSDMSKVGVVTEDALGKALRGDKNMIFSDPKKLASQLNAYNADEKNRCLALISKLQKFVQQIDSSIAENNKKADQYISEMTATANLGGIPGTDGVVVIND